MGLVVCNNKLSDQQMSALITSLAINIMQTAKAISKFHFKKKLLD